MWQSIPYIWSQSQLLKDRGQAGWMDAAATPIYKEGACWAHKERESFGALIRAVLVVMPFLLAMM